MRWSPIAHRQQPEIEIRTPCNLRRYGVVWKAICASFQNPGVFAEFISNLGIAITRTIRKNTALPNHGAKQPARRSIDACFHCVRCYRYNFRHSPIRCAMEKQGKLRQRRHFHCHKSNIPLYNDSYQFSRFVDNIRPAKAWTKSSTAVSKGGFGMPLETLSPSQVSLILKVRFHLLQNSQILNI